MPASIPASSTGSPKVKLEIDESTFKFDVVPNRRSHDGSDSFSELLNEPESLTTPNKYFFYSTPEDIQEEKEVVRKIMLGEILLEFDH